MVVLSICLAFWAVLSDELTLRGIESILSDCLVGIVQHGMLGVKEKIVIREAYLVRRRGTGYQGGGKGTLSFQFIVLSHPGRGN